MPGQRRGAAEAHAIVTEIRATGGRADLIAADLGTPDRAHALARRARPVIGDWLDVRVANAGISTGATIDETSVEDFDRMFAINVRAPYFLVQQLLPTMGEGSNVVLVSFTGDTPRVDGGSKLRAARSTVLWPDPSFFDTPCMAR